MVCIYSKYAGLLVINILYQLPQIYLTVFCPSEKRVMNKRGGSFSSYKFVTLLLRKILAGASCKYS